MIICKGSLLKTATLLIELETAICFLYLCIVLYFGYSPSNLILVIWILALIVSVVIPCKKAKELSTKKITRKKDAR